MDIAKKIYYNQAQALKFGWDPEWFGATAYNKDLIEKISHFQRLNHLEVDGLCGPATYRRIYAQREAQESNYIVYNGKKIPIHWDKIYQWDHPKGLSSKAGAYKARTGKPDRNPSMFINHWSVSLSSRSTAHILAKRSLSVHFSIDNDSTIYQLLDCQDIAYHAGNHNAVSVGVEIENAYALKYQQWYQRRGFGERPVWEGIECHGKKLKPFLGFYAGQLRALAALWEAVSRACSIPLAVPKTLGTVDPECQAKTFKGFACHYNLTERKIDPIGIPMGLVLADALAIRRRYH